MVGIVKIALNRPYTFVVMGLLILIFGVISIRSHPGRYFPNINIPVISVVFSYNGLSPDNMAGRIVTYYERGATTSVNNISTSISNRWPTTGSSRYFPAKMNISQALAQIGATSQTVLKQMPAGSTRRPSCVRCVERPDPADRAVERPTLTGGAV